MSRRNQTTATIPDESVIDNSGEMNGGRREREMNKQASELHVLPSATLHGKHNNLKKIKSFRKLRQSYKIDNQKSIFLNDMQSMLSHMNTDENELNLELMVEICNIANEFFIYGESETRETSKSEAVHELLLPYFRDDELLLNTMFDSVQHKIVKSNFIKRLLKRVKNFFF
jgi:hypothetical protein